MVSSRFRRIYWAGVLFVLGASVVLRSPIAAQPQTLHGLPGPVFQLAFSPDGQTLAAAHHGGTEGGIALWRLKRDSAPSKIVLRSWITSICFSPDGKLLAGLTYDTDGGIKFWDAKTGQLKRTFPARGGGRYHLSFWPDETKLTYMSSDGIQQWDAASGKFIGTLTPSSALAYSPDGRSMVSADYDDEVGGTLTLWDIRDGKRLRTLKIDTHQVDAVAFSPSGSLLAVSTTTQSEISTIHRVTWWNVQTGELLKSVKSDSMIRSLTFAPNQIVLVGGGYDHTIKLWDARTGDILSTLLGHKATVETVVYAPDGKLLGSGSEDGIVKLWTMNTNR